MDGDQALPFEIESCRAWQRQVEHQQVRLAVAAAARGAAAAPYRLELTASWARGARR